MTTFKKEIKYLVLSYKDIKSAGFTEEDDAEMYRLLNMVALARAQRGKPPMECVVVESDWRCYGKVWNMLEMEHNHNISEEALDATEAKS